MVGVNIQVTLFLPRHLYMVIENLSLVTGRLYLAVNLADFETKSGNHKKILSDKFQERFTRSFCGMVCACAATGLGVTDQSLRHHTLGTPRHTYTTTADLSLRPV